MSFKLPKFPHVLHGGDYNPEQWLEYPEILEQDIVLMKKANINCVSVGIFSWAALEPEEGVYRFEWLDRVIDRLYHAGIYTILATPSGAKPLWLSEKVPQVRRVSQNLVRDLSGQRHNHCYSSPIYREKVKIMDTMLANRYASHPGVILWHISNEYGGECYCPICQENFRNWLRCKYETIDQLNRQWWTYFWSHQYSDWKQIHPPVPNGEMSVHGLVLDWKRFVTHQTTDFMKMEIEAVKSANPNIPVTTNLMGFYNGLDYFRLSSELDVVSWDNYPLWHSPDPLSVAVFSGMSHDLMRSMKRQPFYLMESSPSCMNWTSVSKLKRPGMHLLASMQAIAHGANSVQYFQWRKSRGSFEKFHGAVVGHDGTGDTRVFREVSQVGETLRLLDEKILSTQVKAEVAIVYDWENRWAMENAAGPRNCGMHYLETIQQHYRPFWEMGIQVDLVHPNMSLERYKLVIIPMLYLLQPGFAENIRKYVEAGGTVVVTYWTGVVNENDLCFMGKTPGEGLDQVLGIEREEIDALYDGQENSFSAVTDLFPGTWRISELCEIIKVKTAQVLSVYDHDFYKGSPVLTVHSYGKGTAYYLAAKAEDDFYRAFYRRLSSDLLRALDVDFPSGVTAHIRQGKNDLIFLENYNEEPAEIQLPNEMRLLPLGKPVRTVSLPGYGVAFLEKI